MQEEVLLLKKLLMNFQITILQNQEMGIVF
jgi:hypothetical protein